MIGKIVLVIFIINVVTAGLARIAFGGKLVVDRRRLEGNEPKTFIIAGMLSQPESAYTHLSFNSEKVPLRFSVLGFNPKNIARQLEDLVSSDDTLVGISIGCKPIIMSDTGCKQAILINPMTHSIILQAKNQMLIEYLAPEAEALTYLLGWISIIPFIKSDTNDFYSLALLVDQLFWMYYGDPEPDATKDLSNVGIIISTSDEFLDNDVMRGIYQGANQFEINTKHGWTAHYYAAEEYQKAIDFLLLD